MACLKRRGKIYYAQYYVGQKQKMVSLETTSYQLTEEKMRKLESSLFREKGNPLPTKTAISDIVQKVIDHIRVIKTSKSCQAGIYCLRTVFDPACEGLRITSRKIAPNSIPNWTSFNCYSPGMRLFIVRDT